MDNMPFTGLSLRLRIVLIACEFIVATILFTYKLPKRERFATHSCVIAILIVILISLYIALFDLIPKTDNGDISPLIAFSLYVFALVLCVGSTYLLYYTPLMTVLFCCTCACALQNLANGLDGLLAACAGSSNLTLGLLFFPFGSGICGMLVVYVPCYYLLVRHIQGKGLLAVQDKRMLWMTAITVIAVFGLNTMNRAIARIIFESSRGLSYVIALHLVHGTVCIFTLAVAYILLYNKSLRENLSVMKCLMADEARHYRLSRETLEAINARCHDIRQSIACQLENANTIKPELLSRIAQQVDIYDSTIETGNDVLDVILTEKSLLAYKNDVTLSCIVDGSALSDMSPADLYFIFDRALLNAIDAVCTLDSHERRVIGLDVRRVGGMVSLHLEYAFTPERTTPEAGLDLQMMQLLCERYGGTVTTGTNDDTFFFDVLFTSIGTSKP